MSTQTRSTSLLLQVDTGKTDKKVQARSTSSLQAKHNKFLVTLAMWTWVVCVFVSFAFYYAVRNNRIGTEWLAGLLLGTIIVSWIAILRYSRAVNKPIQTPRQGDEK